MSHESSDARSASNKDFVTDAISLPEYLRAESLNGLMPDQPVFLYGNALKYDEATGRLYLDLDIEVKDENRTIGSYRKTKDLLAIMTTLDSKGEPRYIIDASGIKPEAIGRAQSLFTKGVYDYELSEEDGVRAQRRFVSPAVIVFKNLEGEVEYHGDPDYFDSAHYLVEQYDAAIAVNNVTNADDSTEEGNNDNLKAVQPGPEYYWG